MGQLDSNLPFMLQYDNVASFQNGKVRMLDRRSYPFHVEFVECTTYQEVAKAMRDMVTQCGGLYLTASMGMALAAYQVAGLPEVKQKEIMHEAANLFNSARPTNYPIVSKITRGAFLIFEKALNEGRNASTAIHDFALSAHEARHKKMGNLAKYFLKLIPRNSKLLIQNFGDTVFEMMLKEAKASNMNLKLYCTEIRPYLQGARLVASIAKEMDFDVTVITDNMSPFLIDKEGIETCASSADLICQDGHIVNKIGTYQLAIVANYMRIPYYACGAPERTVETVNDVEIEMRDPEYIFEFGHEKLALKGVKGYYPTYDITPPNLVSGVVTDCGVFSPYNLSNYPGTGIVGEYLQVR